MQKSSSIIENFIKTATSLTDLTDQDISVIDSLKSEVDTAQLEKYILELRQHEKDLTKKAEEKAADIVRPFRDIPIDRLRGLLNHPHIETATGAKEELARRELIAFTTLTYPGYIVNWHHEAYAKKLDAFAAGKIKKLMVFLQPQSGKSELCSRRMPAKALGDNPDLRIALASYNHTFAAKFNRSVQRIIDSEEYQRLYPDTRLSAPATRFQDGNYLRNTDEFEIVNHNGGFVSVGTGGALTGRAVDILIIDDPYKDQKQAWSPIIRQSVQEWYETVALTRLHNNSQQLLTLTRWHEDDLAGWLLKKQPDEWEIVCFPAIKEGPPSLLDPRQEGEALWPEVHSLERMREAEKRNPSVFAAMYQQNPKPAKGLLFPADSLTYFDHDDIKDITFDFYIGFSDVADRGKDYYSAPLAGVKDGVLYLMTVIYTKEPVEVTIPRTVEMIDKWRPVRHRFEANAGGTIYAHSVREKKTSATIIEDAVTTSNKEAKIRNSAGIVKERCRFWKTPPDEEYAAFMKALTSYLTEGGNTNDDAPDSLTMLVEMVNPVGPPVEIQVIEKKIPKGPGGFLKKTFGKLSGGPDNKWDW